MNLKLKKAGQEPGQRRMTNLLGLDFSTSGIKAIRLKRVKDQLVVTAADILAPGGHSALERPDIPKPLSAYYTALCASTENALVRVFGHVFQEGEENIEAIVRSSLSTADDYRAGGIILSRAQGKRESSLLGVAVPEDELQDILSLFASGAPAPHSFELSGLAACSAFLYTRGSQISNQLVCLIETGVRFTYVAFFHRKKLQLINRFPVGGSTLQKEIQSELGVDADMAQAILQDGSVDVAAPIRKALASFMKQVSVYREFVERQNKRALDGVYLSGGEAGSSYWQSAVEEIMGVPPSQWSPFEKVEIAPDAFPESLKGQELRFSAAMGAALAGMEAL